MRKLLTVEQMKNADFYTIERLGVPSLTLMERAGKALSERVESTLPQFGKVVCVCGGGNNGGDGFVCARILKEKGISVSVVCLADKFSTDCAVVKRLYEQAGGKILKEFPPYADVVVDCLLGTGFVGELRPTIKAQIENINEYKRKGAYIVSADIPSGLNGNNGLKELCVSADETVAIGEEKLGLYLNDGIDVSGKITRVDIGIELPDENYFSLIEKEEIASLLPKRKRNTHKGSYGSCALLGGCIEYTGAPYLSALAALRSGAGYVSLCVPDGIAKEYFLKTPELLIKSVKGGDRVRFLEESFRSLLGFDSLAFGMGAGVSLDVYEGVKYLLHSYEGKLLLDADALNSIARYCEDIPALFKEKKCDVVITPHIKEFSRLTKKNVDEILSNGVSIAMEFATACKVTVLLKNAATIITDGKNVSLNIRGSAGQAKGGSGDALAGVLVSLLAQGLSVYDGAKAAAYLTGKAAELCEAELGEYSFTATDVIQSLPKAFLSLRLL